MSDSDKILALSKKLGCFTIKRPKKISLDNSSTEEAIFHFLKNSNIQYSYIMLLQPTSPLRHVYDINNSFKTILENKKNSIFSASYFEDLTIWQKYKNKIKAFNYDANKRKPRQYHNGFYLENGSVYICKTSLILKKMNILDPKSVCYYLMNKMKSFEIDNIDDFILCEKIFKKKIY